jgi:drug/metabolite transporter (DMT)-like permease
VSKGQIGGLLIVVLSCIGVLADTMLKQASADHSRILNKWLIYGVILSCVFAVGWMFLMRVMKLATAGVLYGVGSAVLLCLIGVFAFEEKLSSTELAGLAAAALAIALLGQAE